MSYKYTSTRLVSSGRKRNEDARISFTIALSCYRCPPYPTPKARKSCRVELEILKAIFNIVQVHQLLAVHTRRQHGAQAPVSRPIVCSISGFSDFESDSIAVALERRIPISTWCDELHTALTRDRLTLKCRGTDTSHRSFQSWSLHLYSRSSQGTVHMRCMVPSEWY